MNSRDQSELSGEDREPWRSHRGTWTTDTDRLTRWTCYTNIHFKHKRKKIPNQEQVNGWHGQREKGISVPLLRSGRPVCVCHFASGLPSRDHFFSNNKFNYIKSFHVFQQKASPVILKEYSKCWGFLSRLNCRLSLCKHTAKGPSECP